MPAPQPTVEALLGCPTCGDVSDAVRDGARYCPRCGAELRAGAAPRELPDAWVGRVIAERYRLVALVGQGGMGAVYRAEHVRMGKALALKILRSDFAADEGAVARFRDEAHIVSRLGHPHTIAVFDFGEVGAGAGFYLAMEYVPGKDLAALLREQGPLPEARAGALGQQILGSLAEAHDAGIVHRDMKPANVMLMQTRSGEDFVKVLDFGIAKLRDETPAAAGTTGAGAIVGTPNYLAPEQARAGAVDARADLYAVGCLLYELVAGRPPFVAPNPMAVVSAHLHDPPPPLAELARGTSARFAAVVHRALAKDPAARFRSADEMREALAAAGEPTAPRAAPSSPPRLAGELRIASREDFRDVERQLRAIRRSRLAAPAAVAVLLAGLGLAAWRWPDVYALLAERAPRIAAALPAALRPSDLYDGVEHEPNDSPAQSNPLPLVPAADRSRAAGIAVVRGHVGARLDRATGDVDVFRIEVPAIGARAVLVAEWSGERVGEGVPGLDVALTLNRAPGAGVAATAPLVANVDRGGPGRPETLSAAVEPGVYYLAVRERHREDAEPVERPGDAYVLRVRLAEPRPGEEVEPNDAPDAVEAREVRYPEWRAVAERNPLGEGTALRAETSPEDPDTFAIAPRGAGESPRLVLAVPEPALALAAERWLPDAVDLGPRQPRDRLRFEHAADGAPGEVLVVKLGSVPSPGAPALVQVRGVSGEGRYTLLALGDGDASRATVLRVFQELAAAGRVAPALELAAAFAGELPAGPGRSAVLEAAADLARRTAGGLRRGELRRFDRASQLAGSALFEGDARGVRYRGVFEALAAGTRSP